MFGKKCLGKVHQVHNRSIGIICPPARKFKTIARLFSFLLLSVLLFFDMRETSCVTVIFGMSSIGNYKDLHIFKQTTPCPKTLSLVTVNLIECFLDSYTSSFEFHMHKGKSVHQNSNIITVWSLPIVDCVLINNLQNIIMDIGFVDEIDIFFCTVITFQNLDMIFLDSSSLLSYTLIWIGNLCNEKMFPFLVAKLVFV